MHFQNICGFFTAQQFYLKNILFQLFIPLSIIIYKTTIIVHQVQLMMDFNK